MKQCNSRSLRISLGVPGIFIAGLLWIGVPQPAAGATPCGMKITHKDTFIVVSAEDKPVLKYRYSDVPFKPYVQELYTPGGVQILRDSPADHLHHRGLMYGLFVDDVDFWTERDRSGRQINRGLAEITTGADKTVPQVGWTEKIDWQAPGVDVPLLSEQRDITVHGRQNHGETAVTLVTWHCRLRPGPGRDSVKISGTHYDGLGMRFVESMDQTGDFIYQIQKAGPVVRGTERLTPCAWAAYTASVGDKPVTVAIFSSPTNPRSPAGMFTMLKPFAYLSATPQVWKNPMVIHRDETLEYYYGIVLGDGAFDAQQLESLYQEWLRLLPDSQGNAVPSSCGGAAIQRSAYLASPSLVDFTTHSRFSEAYHR